MTIKTSNQCFSTRVPRIYFYLFFVHCLLVRSIYLRYISQGFKQNLLKLLVKKSLPRYFNNIFCQRSSAFVVLPLGFYKLFSLPKDFFVNFFLSTGFRVEKRIQIHSLQCYPYIKSFWRGSLVLNPSSSNFCPKSLGRSMLFGQNLTILGFIAFLLTSFSKICLGRGLGGSALLPLTHSPPSCKPFSEELRIKAPISLHDFKFKFPN